LLNYSKICTLTGTLSVIVINSVYKIDTVLEKQLAKSPERGSMVISMSHAYLVV